MISYFDYFKVFVLCSGNVAVDVDQLHVKRINLMSFSYIVIEDTAIPFIKVAGPSLVDCLARQEQQESSN
jgi:hypothetical protein